jgi:predicted nucleic acid-binding protein
MPDESSPFADEMLDRIAVSGAVVPPLFKIEVGNALLLAVRRKRIRADFCARAFDRIGALPLEQDTRGTDHVWTTCMDLAATHGLSLYDATYLELARRLGLSLATLDTRLAEAANRAGVASPWPGA